MTTTIAIILLFFLSIVLGYTVSGLRAWWQSQEGICPMDEVKSADYDKTTKGE